MDIHHNLPESSNTSFSGLFQPQMNSNLTYSPVTGKPKTLNFPFWRCCPQEHLPAFTYVHMKNKYWNTNMKRIHTFKTVALRTKLKIYANIYPHFYNC